MNSNPSCANHDPPRPNPYGERVSAMEAERAGEAIIGTASGTVPGAPRRAGQREGAVRRVNRAVAKVAARDLGAGRDPVAAAKARACKGAWNAALATRLSELDGADRLELLLRTRGETDFALLLARAGDPTSLKAAARELLDAGRIAVREVGGAHLVSATRVLDAAGREDLSRELLRIMVTSRVTVPKGTKLARRVAAHKGHLKYGKNARRFMAFPNGNPNGNPNGAGE